MFGGGQTMQKQDQIRDRRANEDARSGLADSLLHREDGELIKLFIPPIGTGDQRSWSRVEKSIAGSGKWSSRNGPLLRNTDLAKARWQLEAGARAPLLIARQSVWLN